MPNYDALRPRIVRADSGWVAIVDDGGPILTVDRTIFEMWLGAL